MKLSYHRIVALGPLLGLLLSTASLMSCSHSSSVQATTGADDEAGKTDAPNLEIVHEECDIDSSDSEKVDVNGDKKPDLTTVMSGGKKVCSASDLNFDGKIDRYTYYDDSGKIRREESDYDRDGKIDEIAIYKNGQLVSKARETNLDDKLDTWDTFENGKIVKRLRDSNADGRVEQWWTFPDPNNLECPVVAYDTDGDGRPDDKLDVCKEREKEARESGFDQINQNENDAGSTQPTNDSNEPTNQDNANEQAQDAGTSNSNDTDGGAQ